MPELTKLANIAKRAGDMALQMQPTIVANKNGEIEHKPDGSVITPADIEAHKMIMADLNEHFPNIPVVSEESSKESRETASQAPERFETDPVDNTGGYAKGRDGYSVNIGRIKDGEPIEGAVYFPAREELYFTGQDGNAYLQKADNAPKRISASRLPIKQPLQVVTGFSEQHLEHLDGRDIETKKLPAQLRTCSVATGECDISGINKGAKGGFNTWDVAGPHAVLKAAGGEMVTEDGKPLTYPEGNLKLPNHIAGAKDVLIALGISESQDLNNGRKIH